MLLKVNTSKNFLRGNTSEASSIIPRQLATEYLYLENPKTNLYWEQIINQI